MVGLLARSFGTRRLCRSARSCAGAEASELRRAPVRLARPRCLVLQRLTWTAHGPILEGRVAANLIPAAGTQRGKSGALLHVEPQRSLLVHLHWVPLSVILQRFRRGLREEQILVNKGWFATGAAARQNPGRDNRQGSPKPILRQDDRAMQKLRLFCVHCATAEVIFPLHFLALFFSGKRKEVATLLDEHDLLNHSSEGASETTSTL